MSNDIKDLSVSSSSLIGFKVEWHRSRFNKWYQSQGHGFESRECHCEGEIVGGITIWLPTTTLKTGLRGTISNAIKNFNVFSSSLISFEVEWHSSWSDRLICWNPSKHDWYPSKHACHLYHVYCTSIITFHFNLRKRNVSGQDIRS